MSRPQIAEPVVSRSAEEIEAWLIAQVRAQANLPAGDAIDPHLPFSYYGLDSLDAVDLATALEAWLGTPVSPALAWDYPTIHAMAGYLAGGGTAEGDDAAASEASADADAVLAELGWTAEEAWARPEIKPDA